MELAVRQFTNGSSDISVLVSKDSRKKAGLRRDALIEHPKKILDIVIQEKLKNRKRGPRKVRAQLKRKHPELDLPAVSTIGYWFKKEGLVERRKKRLHVPPYTQPFSNVMRPMMFGASIIKGNFI